MLRRVLPVVCLASLVAPLPATDPPKKPTPEEVRKKFYGCWLELDRVAFAGGVACLSYE